MYVKNKVTGKYAGQINELYLDLNPHLVPLEDGEDVYLTADDDLVVSRSSSKGFLSLRDRPSDQHKNIDGKWVIPDLLTFTDSNGDEITYDVSDTDYLRLLQAREALSLGAKKVKVSFSSGDSGVFDSDRLGELFAEAFKIKSAEYVVE